LTQSRVACRVGAIFAQCGESLLRQEDVEAGDHPPGDPQLSPGKPPLETSKLARVEDVSVIEYG